MENDTFKIDAVHSKVICELKEEIERKFEVQIFIEEKPPENEVNRFCTCKVVTATVDAQENVEKAKHSADNGFKGKVESVHKKQKKLCEELNRVSDLQRKSKYIHALTSSGEDFTILTENYDVDIFSKIFYYKSLIEKKVGVIIVTSERENGVSIKGNKHDVKKAKQFIDSLPFGQSNGNQQLESKFSHFPPTLMKKNTGIRCDSSSFKTSDDSMAHSNNSDEDSSEEDSDELLEQEIRNYPDYQSKLEFAFKLGYYETDLLEAFKRLNKDAGQNELLSELIKNSAQRQEDWINEEAEYEEDSSKQGGGETEVSQKKVLVGDESSTLKHIIVDGSNVAMSHGNKETFSCMGIKLAVDWFRERGHTGITVFVPQWRKETSRTDSRIRDQQILNELEKEKVLVFTPSRRIGGKRVICYDDRYILKLAVETDGIVVSNDNYRDLIGENEQFKKVVEERLLMYSFVNDRFMPPDDPLGRSGPTLDNFLMKEPAEPEPLPPPCPYGSKKCTYGNKCKYYHPERRTQPHKSVTERLVEQAKQRKLEMRRENSQPAEGKKKLTRTKTPLQRTQSSNTEELRKREITEETEEKNKMDEYNQKLSDSLIKMELDRALNESDIVSCGSPRNIESRDFSTRSKLDQLDRSSPRLSELRQKGRGSSRGNSPINLLVPGHSEQQDDGEKFLSGHLLLAKKLSDEASESDKLKKKPKAKVEETSGMSNTKSDLVFSNSEFQNPELVRKQPLSRVSDKQKLSRQLSLQGGEDPRLGRIPLHAQLSYDPRRLRKEQQLAASAMNQEDRQKMLKDFMHVQCQDMRAASGDDDQQQQPSTQQLVRGHTAVARMQSAPDTCLQTSPSPRQLPIMTRQNSSSDTQLNKLLDFENDTQIDGLLARGPSDNFLMRDTKGSVTFQIGGPANQNMPHYRSITSPGYSYSPVSPIDFRFQQQSISPDYQHHGSHFLPSNPMMSPRQQNFSQVQTPFHYSPSNVPYLDQSNLWAAQNQVQQNVSNIPQQYIPRNLSPHTILNQDVNIQPNSMTNTHGHIQPVPVEMPILPNSSRFQMYRYLCNLFPEEIVRTVMNQHPEENNPKRLCAYIISYP